MGSSWAGVGGTEGGRAAVIRREMPFPIYSLRKWLVSSYSVPSLCAGTEGVGWVLGKAGPETRFTSSEGPCRGAPREECRSEWRGEAKEQTNTSLGQPTRNPRTRMTFQPCPKLGQDDQAFILQSLGVGHPRKGVPGVKQLSPR